MEALPEDTWSPYKHLYKVIERTLACPTATSAVELEMHLKKFKQSFSAILRNPPKNERSRSQLLSGIIDGIAISSYTRTMPLSKDLVDECIIISDMFDLDEFIALELLCTAQRQMPQHPGLPRGLVAILLYYDGRKALACSLRDLFQVTSGVSWATDIPKEITNLISTYTQCLVDDSNILERIINLLDELDIAKESVLLTKNRALGSKKHQNQVQELFQDVRVALAMALFNWSAQRGLPKTIVAKLIKNLSKCEATEATGVIDDVTLTMLMALLYSCDTSILQKQEDISIAQKLPIISDPDFAQHVYDVLVAEHTGENLNNLNCIMKMCFALSLASFRHAPQNVQYSLSKVIEHDEQLIDEAIASKVFEFIYYYILDNKMIYKTEFFYRRLHMLFTDFIDFMHSKVTELRGKADETARTIMSFMKEGLEPPSNLDHSFEMLMLCIGKFYKDNQAGLSLCVEYWGPLDIAPSYTKTTTREVSLFKFIRLAGELLPSTLFVSYLKMIAGLTSCERSARNAFNLLKQASGLTGSTTLSWEHFFGSLIRYYTNLRQEQSPGGDTIYRNRIFNRSINPQEIEGLCAVLEVIRAVANYDEFARIAICEHPNWAPLHVLLGLLSCSVPLQLKAQILKALAALAKSKETAISIWNNLEASQIIATIPTTNSYICNLETEINQNECRLESYPLSQGILELLYSLVTTHIPRCLGAGPRKPGFDPYLTFIIDGIFLKFYDRTYKSIAEKWAVGAKCLKLLHYLQQMYEIAPQDFDEIRDENPPPGYHIMLQLHTKSDFLRLILLIIDEARMQLDEYNKFQGKEQLEECALHCLNILENGLMKQDTFFTAHSIANSSILLFGLNKILLDINPRSRRPDHVLNTTKFVTYFSWLPQHALISVKILNMVSRLPNVTSQILDMFTANSQLQQEIRQGFVECLESESAVMSQNTADNVDGSNAKIELKIKDAIIELLEGCLSQPSPNLTMFLLGFDISKDFSEKQKFGVIDSMSNCIKSLVALLDSHLELKKNVHFYDADNERIVERSYSLLYALCANQRTSDVILRYLRSCNDFLCRHLKELPFQNIECAHVLNQISNLLKTTAIELKLSATYCQLSRVQQLCKLLVGSSGKDVHNNTSTELNNYYSYSVNILAETETKTESASNFLLCNVLDWLTFEMKDQICPKWEFFDSSLTKQILSECEFKAEQGPKLINIKRLHQILNEELCTVQSTIASGQRKLILQEMESILIFALKVNEDRNKNCSMVKLMEAWRQVTEVLFCCAPEQALATTTKQELILEVLQKLLSKVVPIQPIFDISVLASEATLILLVNLRYCFFQAQEIGAPKYGKTKPARLETSGDLNVTTSKTHFLNLKFIIKNILEWIIVSNVASQKLRINLYAALLNCLRILKGNVAEDTSDMRNASMLRLDDSTRKSRYLGADYNQLRMSAEVFLSFGDKLIDILCHDCISGHDICKMSALSCFVAIVDMDTMPGVINFISNRGYLTNLIDGLMKSDEELCRTLSNTVDNIKPIYVYESNMAVLLRLASLRIGAELLLSNKVMSVLSTMKVFDMHPDIQNNTLFWRADAQSFIPTADTRFRQILFPALSFCDCLVSTLGPENESAMLQIVHFLLSHIDMIEIILRTGMPYMDLGLLQELSAVTGLIARTANKVICTLDSTNNQNGANLYRIQRLMLATFSHFVVNDDLFKKMLKPDNSFYEPTEANKNLHVKYFLEISANVAIYLRNTISNHSLDHRSNDILFTASIKDLFQRNENCSTGHIDVILNQLKGSVEYYHIQKAVANSLLRQSSSLTNTTFDATAQCTYNDLVQRYAAKQNELSLCVFIIEQNLFLLWAHLDFFMRCISCTGSNNKPRIQGNLQGLISLEDISLLKKNLISIFNETFCKQLLSASETESETGKTFNEALLRRIKAFIQFVPVM